MEFIKTKIDGVVIAEPKVFGDHRGFFMESYSKREFEKAGLFYDFVQDNHSSSTVKGPCGAFTFRRGTRPRPSWYAVPGVLCWMWQWTCVPTALPTSSGWRWSCLRENKRQLLIPQGFGHGFVTLTDHVEFLYKADNYYAPEADGGIRWNDPELSIDWGVKESHSQPEGPEFPLAERRQNRL